MPLVNVLVNGRAYTVACDDGEEEHLRELAQFLDKRVRELVESVGQVGDTRLLVMAGLLVTDELAETLGHLEECRKEIDDLKARLAQSERPNAEEVAADALEVAAARLEDIAVRIART